jgi:hypothetical protein
MFNLTKVPIFVVLTRLAPANPIYNGDSLRFNLIMVPVIVVGVCVGKWLLPRISQARFNNWVLFLAGIAAINLIVPFKILFASVGHLFGMR